ncbi:MAG: hypothetical protein ABIS06_00085 [Vicinamibacterales bacterium]
MDERNSAPATGTASGAGNNQSGTAGIAGRVREQATAQLSKQKDRATEGLGSVADAVRGTTEQLRNNQHDKVAQFAEQAAQQIDRLSERLRNKDVTELLDDAQELARRKPAMFIGGAFALGLLGARFMKSSAATNSGDREWRRQLPTPYESGGNTYRPASQSTSGSYGSTSVGTMGTSGSTAGRAGTNNPGRENY